MCGCGGNKRISIKSLGNNRVLNCSTSTPIIISTRNKLTILHNSTSDTDKRSEYNTAMSALNDMLKDSLNNCPDEVQLQILIDYTNNEYAKYN